MIYKLYYNNMLQEKQNLNQVINNNFVFIYEEDNKIF